MFSYCEGVSGGGIKRERGDENPLTWFRGCHSGNGTGGKKPVWCECSDEDFLPPGPLACLAH